MKQINFHDYIFGLTNKCASDFIEVRVLKLNSSAISVRSYRNNELKFDDSTLRFSSVPQDFFS